jgi:phosphatidylglycerophosphatase A
MMIDRIALLIATGFGAGNLPYAPGTWGSVAGFIFMFAAYAFLGPLGFTLLVIASILVGYWSCMRVLPSFTEADPSVIVIDEIAGMALTLWLIYLWSGHFDAADPLLAFGLFRVFDILKPIPINWIEDWCEKDPRRFALGIMADDLAAAVMAFGVWAGIRVFV